MSKRACSPQRRTQCHRSRRRGAGWRASRPRVGLIACRARLRMSDGQEKRRSPARDPYAIGVLQPRFCSSRRTHTMQTTPCSRQRSASTCSDLALGRPGLGGFGRDGETRNRTEDTTIFSRMLYQLSYLAATHNPIGSAARMTALAWRSGPAASSDQRPRGRPRPAPRSRLSADSGPHGPAAVTKAIDRSSGAVSNCLQRLAASKRAQQVSDQPRRYSHAA
jgi:hypothetical protein